MSVRFTRTRSNSIAQLGHTRQHEVLEVGRAFDVAEAIAIMVEASKLKQEDVAKSYDFLHKNAFFETTGKVSRAKMGALLAALKGLGDIEGSTNLERFVLPGVTQLSD